MTKRYLLKFNADNVDEPIIAKCAREAGVLLDVLRADATDFAVVRFEDSDEKKAVEFFKKEGVEAKELKNAVIKDPEKCIDCGACISLCPTKCFSFDKDGKVVYDEDKCVLCKNCIDACPRRALKLPEY